ncbi:extensin-like [Penaeus monodon]|uniref:extensin-like n=1 Tax=Penaeus monodon TaxID=6687 RepID=UPI0018A74DE9|nr:extensin-like [Penaeus monodon]
MTAICSPELPELTKLAEVTQSPPPTAHLKPTASVPLPRPTYLQLTLVTQHPAHLILCPPKTHAHSQSTPTLNPSSLSTHAHPKPHVHSQLTPTHNPCPPSTRAHPQLTPTLNPRPLTTHAHPQPIYTYPQPTPTHNPFIPTHNPRPPTQHFLQDKSCPSVLLRLTE